MKDNDSKNDLSNCFENKFNKNCYLNSEYFMPNPGNIDEQNNNKNINFDFYNNFNDQKDSLDIIYLLQNNPNINSYIYIVDCLTKEELSMMFSFILKNIAIFTSNTQSFILIDKIISLYKSKNNIKKEENTLNNEIIYSFLNSFFNKRIPFLIHSNNYISIIINLVIKLEYPKNDFIFLEIKNDFKNYAYNRQGCILIQNLYPLGNEMQKQNLLGEILQQYNDLIVDKYGHYLFKYLLYQPENGEKYYKIIYNKIINDVKRYTNNKYSSVVIERLLDSSDSNIKNHIIEKICSNENDVVELLYHAYGNYVLQKIINDVKNDNILGMIYKTIIKNKNSLYKLSYGKKIMKEINSVYTLK